MVELFNTMQCTCKITSKTRFNSLRDNFNSFRQVFRIRIFSIQITKPIRKRICKNFNYSTPKDTLIKAEMIYVSKLLVLFT